MIKGAGVDMEDHELQELFRFATGEGRWAWTGPYMHTHQGRHRLPLVQPPLPRSAPA